MDKNINVVTITSVGHSFETFWGESIHTKGSYDTSNLMKKLLEILSSKGISIKKESFDPCECRAVVFMDNFPLRAMLKYKNAKWIYCGMEPYAVRPINREDILLRLGEKMDFILSTNVKLEEKIPFKKVCTYIDIHEVNNGGIFPGMMEREILAVQISGNWKNNHPASLYYLREEVASFFNKNHPSGFELYGSGWDTYDRVYRGRVDAKWKVYERSKFAFAFENNTEMVSADKLLDCLVSGVVPICAYKYDMSQYFPDDIYINYFKFKNLEELYQYLAFMAEDEWKGYIERGQAYLRSEQVKQFDVSSFAEIFAETVLQEARIENRTYLDIFSVYTQEIRGKVRKVLSQDKPLSYLFSGLRYRMSHRHLFKH